MLELLALGLAAVAVIVALQIVADRAGLPAAAPPAPGAPGMAHAHLADYSGGTSLT